SLGFRLASDCQKLVFIVSPSFFFFTRTHLETELFLGKSVHQSYISETLQRPPLARIVILHELIDQNFVAVTGCADTQSHPAGGLSFAVSAVNVNASCFFLHAAPFH